MGIPAVIELLPLDRPVQAEIAVPGSKSITNRALVLAALGDGETTLRGALWSEDTQVMVECLQELGFMVNVAPDPHETCNRTLTVYGKGGTVPRGGTAEQPLELFVGNAGTAARFLAAMVCLGTGVYRLHGVPRMHQRPQAALFAALRELGYRVDSPNNMLPALIHGAGRRSASCSVSITESSQFASALLLASAKGGWTVRIAGHNAEESAYVTLTTKMLAAFPAGGGMFQIEPDASSGSYFLALNQLLRQTDSGPSPGTAGRTWPTSQVKVANWPASGWQVDEQFANLLPFWKHLQQQGGHWALSREHDLGDSIMTAIVMAPFASQAVRFNDLGRLRLQECERVAALRTELGKCGARVLEEGDSLLVYPSAVHGAEIETYNDHRMAMCFAILGLKVPGIKIKNPACVKKTFPNFFQKLAGTPPRGLGARLRDANTGRVLTTDEVFAD